jgi:beta-mannosidase
VPGAAADPAALDALAPRWLPATVPGTVASALRAAGTSLAAIGAPARLDGADWWFRRPFVVQAAADGERLFLALDGLATVADVWLNGAPILHSESMFIASAVDITERLTAAGNDLVIRFAALDPLLAARRPRPRWRAPMVEHQQLRWFRTTLLGRTPGWSPPLPPVGPWRAVRLERRRALQLDDADLRAGLDGDDGTLALDLRLRALGGLRVSAARVLVTGAGGPWEAALNLETGVAGDAPEGSLRAGGVLRLPGVARWWPHTHGDQPLYQVRALIAVDGQEITIDMGRVGFRTITLTTDGGAFALAVNGQPVFCRGACWTPVDAADLTGAAADVEATLRAVRAAGMNMLRVCGPMVYESKLFHDLCDQLGILLWQDFMFANMDYPEEPAFVASVEAEARQALQRWQGRPSLAILCGDSEGEQQAAMWGAPRAAWHHRPMFRETLPALARAICPDVPYWPSSASGGAFPHQPSAGSTSYYGVGAYRRPLEDARRSGVRFASECLAFANIPDDPTLAALTGGAPARAHTPIWKAGVPRDLGAGWDFDDVRDHYLGLLFGLDPTTLRSNDPDRFVALGRVVTGEVMAAAFAEWRRGDAACRGALVWFLRDLVAGAGWGLLDVGGRPKAAYHYVRRVLQPLAVFFSDEGLNGVNLHAVNDGATPWEGELQLALFRDGELRVGGGAVPVVIPARGALERPAAALLEGFTDTTYAYHFGPPGHDLSVVRLVASDGAVVREAFHFPLGHGSRTEAELGVTASVRPLPDGDFVLEVSSRRFAQAVFVDVSGFVPDDNYFHLAPGGAHQVRLQRAGAIGDPKGSVLPLNARAATRIVVTP